MATKLDTSWNVPLFVGSIAADQLAQLFSQEIHAAGGSGKEFLENLGIVESYAACKSANNRQPCPADGNGRYVCKIGWSEWEWHVKDRVVLAMFKNWSGDRSRAATLNVIYAR